ncbi:MAG: helix-turn-helix transcriptional regulator [Hydrococcus sp. RU_2_2]|nr:helix-turn-helix transcriptional regulator [Hydrococcus sp. RU_2_2]NJP17700.1 helix-turn-helix transcriptional regulator [Hydrococcus sp. CRU_1_1]
MKDKQLLHIDCTNLSDMLQAAPFHFLNMYPTGVAGASICHAAQPGYESPLEVVSHQHLLFVHLRPEVGSERRIGDRLEKENVQIGDVAIVPAQATHWQGIEQDIAEAVILILEPEFLAHSASESVYLDRVELLPTFAQPDPLIYGIGLTLKNLLERGTCDTVYAESLLTSLSIHLLRNYCAFEPNLRKYQGGLSKRQLKQAIDYIEANLDRKLTLEAIAKQLNISLYYFCKLFVQSMGIPPYKYVLKQRVERAKRLLKEEKRAIADIALECGFANQTHLNKHFHKLTGTTPKSYRMK